MVKAKVFGEAYFQRLRVTEELQKIVPTSVVDACDGT